MITWDAVRHAGTCSGPVLPGGMLRAVTGTRLYHGTATMLRPGDPLRHDAHVTTDPAEALARAWQEAGTPAGTPFVYRVASRDGVMTVLGDVLIDRELARKAQESADHA